ncbi:MAG: glycosyltransferase family 2 protein [Myxococcales bacterium FL481]|nr:MAG: glycosyltransferase family 2 protein [Myxococcales bacterium FL481]
MLNGDPVKLIIQIPCLNERDQLPATFADLPRSIPGVDEIEVMVIDDGSSDGTSEVARSLGVHHLIRFARNRGLAAAYVAGMDACLRLRADIVVNTDADNQYSAADIAKLVAPILAQDADVVIGDRQTDTIAHFSFVKRVLQRWGSALVRRASGTGVRDSTSGFRALNRRAIATLVVHNRFTYTLETLIHAATLGLTIRNVVVRTNPQTRPSRLFRSIPGYLRRNGAIILRSYALYWPLQTFGFLAAVLFAVGTVLGLRFLYYYQLEPNVSSHIQSLQVGVGAIIMGFVVALMALLGDLIAGNRRLIEELLARMRRIDATLDHISQGRHLGAETLERTAAETWRSPSSP